MFTITNKLRTIVALGAVGTALAGTTLATAAPAFAAPKAPVAVTRTETISYGHGPGASCQSGGGTYGDGTTVTTTVTYSDGSSTTSTYTCQNGNFVPQAQVLPVGAVHSVAVPTANVAAP